RHQIFEENVMKAPTTKHQAPRKLQTPSFNSGIQSSMFDVRCSMFDVSSSADFGLRLRRCLTILSCTLALLTQRSFAAIEPGFSSIFNGKDLTGWDGNPALWSVKDGAIVGQTSEANPIKNNTFLIWTNGQPGDFELRCSFKIEPLNTSGFAN